MIRLAIASLIALAACQPDISEDTACAEAGGRVVQALGPPVCAMPTPDAGLACTDGSGCTGFCLAETQSCAPVTPMFGCHEILEHGDAVTICVD